MYTASTWRPPSSNRYFPGAAPTLPVYAFPEPDEAFEWLDRAYAQRDSSLIGTKVDPLLKSWMMFQKRLSAVHTPPRS
jgi:hypothetical protein